MRVIVNEWSAGGQKTGIGHHTAQLLEHLRTLPGDQQVSTFPAPWIQTGWQLLKRLLISEKSSTETLVPGPTPLAFKTRLRQQLRQTGRAWLAWQFRRTCKQRGSDLYHEPNFLPLPVDLPTVATFHDLSALLHPEWHPRDRVVHFELNMPRTLNQCGHFLTVSEFSRQEIIKHLGVSPERVSVAYNGCRPGLQPLPAEQVAATLRRLGLPGQYVLHVGTLEPRKNLDLLVRAYAALPGAVREQYPLLLVGRWGWNIGPLARCLDEIGKPAGVRHLGYVAEEDLAALYNGARVLAMPSFYEGFGLPVVEMLACGGAVVASTAPALVEVAGRQAHLVNPQDEAGWRAALLRVLTDDAWWAGLRAGALTAAAPFTWQRCAADTLAAYRKTLGQAALPVSLPQAA